MKKILVLMTLVFGMASVFATPKLEGNKIYLDGAAPSKNAVKKFIANNGGEEALDIPDEVGYIKRTQLELFTNPNKVIEFENTADAKRYYNALFSFNDGKPHYYPNTGHYENNEFILFIELSNWCTIPDSTPTYCYVSDSTNGRKLTEEELVPTFDLSMTIKSEADFDTVVWFTEWENGKDGKLVAAWEYIIPANSTRILRLKERATKKDTWIGFSRESITWAGGFDWWKNAIKKVDKNGYLVYMNNGVEEKRQLKRAE